MSSITGSLDTNLILRLLVGDIPEQKKQVENLLKTTTGQIAVADIAIIETVFVLTRRYELDRETVATLVAHFMNLAVINCNRALFDDALRYYCAEPSLSFEDCCLAVYARLNNTQPLYTFDKKLATKLPETKQLA